MSIFIRIMSPTLLLWNRRCNIEIQCNSRNYAGYVTYDLLVVWPRWKITESDLSLDGTSDDKIHWRIYVMTVVDFDISYRLRQ